MGDGVDSFQKARNTLALGHVSLCTGRLCDVHHAGALMHRQQKNTHAGKTFVDFPRRAKTVQHRHRDIQDHQIRSELKGPGHCFLPVVSFPADLKTMVFEDAAHPRAQRFMIIYN